MSNILNSLSCSIVITYNTVSHVHKPSPYYQFLIEENGNFLLHSHIHASPSMIYTVQNSGNLHSYRLLAFSINFCNKNCLSWYSYSYYETGQIKGSLFKHHCFFPFFSNSLCQGITQSLVSVGTNHFEKK